MRIFPVQLNFFYFLDLNQRFLFLLVLPWGKEQNEDFSKSIFEVEMKTYLNSSIKEVIKEFPQIERILADYGIACGSCTMGLCLLKDVLEIHKLPPEKSATLERRLQQTISSVEEIILTEETSTSEPLPEISYPLPFQKLVDEHLWIKRWLSLIPEVISYFSSYPQEKRDLVLKGVDFIRSYADKFHHAKEEEILFKYFPADLDILRVMKEEHNMARSLVQKVLTSLEQEDDNGLTENMKAYQGLLKQHIKKEDEVLFPWLGKKLSPEQIDELCPKFQKAELQMNFNPHHYEKFIEGLEEKLT